ncbi:MAG TPA: apolipoprotein N-acyltransferase, partial [Burkholderiales bacterium]|nr:apolipoprotein N-acyltransferase [Burkholderiales bacterium]
MTGRRKRLHFFFAFVLGALTVLGFAPFSLFIVPALTLAALMLLWQRSGRWQDTAALGFAYGLGLFLFGVSWIYVSLHDFGAMPAPLAAFATLLFCAFLALFPALAGYLYAKVPFAAAIRLAIFIPAAWTLLEWTRGWLFTGFPWLAFGYSQIASSPLAGYAPVLGIYGVTLATAGTAGLIAIAATRVGSRSGASLILHPALILLAVWAGGWALKQIEWTHPVGEPITVSLLQGNVSQDLKWRADRVHATLQDYRTLAQSSASRLIVFPETALPLFLDNVPQDYLVGLASHARKNGGDMLIGVPERLPNGQYYNSVISVGTGAA